MNKAARNCCDKAHQLSEVTSRRVPGHKQHHQSRRNQHERRAEVGFLHDQQEWQRQQADAFPEDRRLPEFIHWTAEEMRLGEDEGELGKFGGLKLERPKVRNPSICAP